MLAITVIILSLLVSSCTTSGSGHATFISELASDSPPGDDIPKVLHILVVLPTATNGSDQDNANTIFQWKRGEEIFPGATLALKEIRGSDHLLNGYQLEVIPVKNSIMQIH